MNANLSSGNKKLLLAFSSTHIDVYDVAATEWIQTINLKSTKPLECNTASSSLVCLSSGGDLPLLVNIVPSGRHDLLLKVKGDPNKHFAVNSVSGAQRLIQTAAGAVIDRPPKVSRWITHVCQTRCLLTVEFAVVGHPFSVIFMSNTLVFLNRIAYKSVGLRTLVTFLISVLDQDPSPLISSIVSTCCLCVFFYQTNS